MKTAAHILAILLICYLVAWTLAYALVMGTDFGYYFSYLGLAWTFRALELPTFIWMLSVALCIPLAGLVLWRLRRNRIIRVRDAA
jgi:hypothetical protein